MAAKMNDKRTTYVLDGMLQSITLVAHVAVFKLSEPPANNCKLELVV